MTEFTKRYYPTICIRRAEMKAMEMLPASEKEKMLPVVLLAPWLNSIKFENTIRIIEDSVGRVPVIVDLDRYFRSTSELPSRKIFQTLVSGEGWLEVWSEILQNNENYIPTIQIFKRNEADLDNQIALAKELNRGFVFRFELEREYDLKTVFKKIAENIDEDILTIFDVGYGDQSLEKIALASGLIDRLIGISAEAKFVVASSSFPNDFSDYDDFSQSQPIAARQLFDALNQQYGNYNLFYGDWASTKPRRYDGGGNAPLPRVDFPTQASWIIARSKEEKWDFEEAAERITRLPEWQDRPIVWGTGMIEKTAEGLPNAIATGPQSIACRVNIHLFVQNNFGGPPNAQAPSGDWIDPI